MNNKVVTERDMDSYRDMLGNEKDWLDRRKEEQEMLQQQIYKYKKEKEFEGKKEEIFKRSSKYIKKSKELREGTGLLITMWMTVVYMPQLVTVLVVEGMGMFGEGMTLDYITERAVFSILIFLMGAMVNMFIDTKTEKSWFIPIEYPKKFMVVQSIIIFISSLTFVVGGENPLTVLNKVVIMFIMLAVYGIIILTYVGVRKLLKNKGIKKAKETVEEYSILCEEYGQEIRYWEIEYYEGIATLGKEKD